MKWKAEDRNLVDVVEPSWHCAAGQGPDPYDGEMPNPN
jgi:hypothetical protein